VEEKEKEKKSPDRPADSAPRKLMNVDFFKKRFSKKAVRIEREGKTKIKTKPLIRVTKLGSVVKGSVNGMS